MDVKLEGAELSTLLHTALLQALGEKGREMIVQNAVTYLTTRRNEGYGRGSGSPLEEMMQTAARDVARKFIEEMVANDQAFRAKMQSVFAEAAERAFSKENRAGMVESLAGAMVATMWKSDHR